MNWLSRIKGIKSFHMYCDVTKSGYDVTLRCQKSQDTTWSQLLKTGYCGLVQKKTSVR
uniref:Uncharacterized protein n=1 Tax=Anguilla anguilla TaxID=7936 RepID=A0A0E9UIZ8_ANGAN